MIEDDSRLAHMHPDDAAYVRSVMALPNGPRSVEEFHRRALQQLTSEQRSMRRFRTLSYVGAGLLAGMMAVEGMTGQFHAGMVTAFASLLVVGTLTGKLADGHDAMIHKALGHLQGLPEARIEALCHVPDKG